MSEISISEQWPGTIYCHCLGQLVTQDLSYFKWSPPISGPPGLSIATVHGPPAGSGAGFGYNMVSKGLYGR